MKHLKKFEGFSNRTCDRCGCQTNTMSMSWLNTDECCPACLEDEKTHPDYEEAKRRESEQVRQGNYNYPGLIEDRKLASTLKLICQLYKNESLGSAEHPAEYFGDGSYLLSIKTQDKRISQILKSIAQYSELDAEGSAEHIFDYMQDEDCHYIADFLGLPKLDLNNDWTEEEEQVWM